MSWEATLLKRTRLGVYRNCLDLAEAYADFAPLWERLCLITYAGLGPTIGRWLGGDTRTAWQRADHIIADLLAVTRLSPREIARLLRSYILIKLKSEEHLPLDQARERIYDQRFYPVVTHFTYALQPSAAARLKFVRESVKAIGEEHLTFADLGCGAGMMLCEVLSMKPGWTGAGLDISPAAIAYARSLAEHKGVAERASFQTGDIARLPFADESLDLLIASEVVEHLPEPEAVLRELARVLRPGGRIVLTVPLASHTPAHALTLERPEDLRSLCERAGLVVQSLRSKWHFGYGDDNTHLFALLVKPVWAEALYSPQSSSAASSGMVSSWWPVME